MNLKSFFLRTEVNVLLVLLILCIIMSIASPYFLTAINIVNILRQFTLIAILSMGMGMIIITGGIDLSVGSMVAFSACIGAAAALAGASPLLTLIIIIVAGAAAGLVNGLLITMVGIPPFVVTLGMMSVLHGASLLVTMGSPIGYNPTWISYFGGGRIGILPVSILLMLLIVVIGFIIMKSTTFGRNIYAIGNSEKAAKLSGIQVDKVKILVYTITGILGGICGLILLGQLEGGDAFYGTGYELEVIAAVVIGGISLSGGRGNILGVVVGAALMGVIKNAFVLLAIPGYWQTVTIGVVIILAVSIDSLRNKRLES